MGAPSSSALGGSEGGLMVGVQRSVFAFLVSLSVGCAASGTAPPVTSRLEDAPAGFVDGSRVLAVVYGEYTRQEIVTPTIDLPVTWSWRQELLGIGVSDADISDGSEIYASSYCWASRRSFDCSNYMAHVDTSLHGKLHYAFDRSTTEPPGPGHGQPDARVDRAAGRLASTLRSKEDGQAHESFSRETRARPAVEMTRLPRV